MSIKNDLKELEKKAYKTSFEDGIWDIFSGMIILSLAFTWIIEYDDPLELLFIFIFIIALNCLAILIFIISKKYVVAPRLGQVKFGQRRKVRKRILMIFLSLMVLINLIFFILTLFGLFRELEISGLIFSLIVGLCFFTIPFGIVAYLLQFFRLFIIGLLGGLCFFLSYLLYSVLGSPFHTLLTFVLVGGFFICFGIVLFIKFIKKYPKPEKEVV